MSSDFGYINARVRGLKAKLLEPEFYTQALGDSDFRAFIGTLTQTPYAQDVEEAQSRVSGLPAVDRALARNFYRTTRSILNFSDGRAHDLIALLLRRYDLMNLKALARAKHAGGEGVDISNALLPAGELKPSLLDHLAAQPDLPALAQALAVSRHPLAREFSRAVRRYASDGDLYELELALDRAYYSSLMDDVDRLDISKDFLRHLQREVDATNLRTALKLRGRSVNADALYIKGGKEISRSTFDAIAAEGGEGAMGNLAGTSFAEVANRDTLAAADAVIRDVVDRSAHRLALSDPLGIGVVVDFLRRKENETARLRLLARGKFYHVPRANLEKELGYA